MLNISNNPVGGKVNLVNYKSGQHIADKNYYRSFNKFSKIFLVIIMVFLFLPWTQNIPGTGNVTTLKPGQRPQTIQSPIPGRIEEWFVQEGDYVKKGDTIVRVSEVKSDYFDELLIQRTGEQISSKSQSIDAYEGKVGALANQISALHRERELKLEQARNKILQAQFKVKSDSIDLEAASTNLRIANTQFERIQTLQEEGLKATKDVEEKRLKLQATQAKFISQENKLLESKNNVINAKIELSRIEANYADKISKVQSDLYTAQTSRLNTEVEVSKLKNSYANYEKRNALLYVTAPQNGYINKAIKGGVGENFKEGESLVNIMPAD